MSFKHVWHLLRDSYVLRIRGLTKGFVIPVTLEEG